MAKSETQKPKSITGPLVIGLVLAIAGLAGVLALLFLTNDVQLGIGVR